MEDNTLVESSFSATINAPIEVDIPSWCFTPEYLLSSSLLPRRPLPHWLFPAARSRAACFCRLPGLTCRSPAGERRARQVRWADCLSSSRIEPIKG